MPARVGIVVGSDSDLPAIRPALETLEDLQVLYELQIISAHRTPEQTVQYAQTAALRGLQVIIAAAGMAAGLPGMLAAYTVLPVIGLPLRSPGLEGVDALYSMVQMPPGVPVATVGLNAARNAALLACQILALQNPELQEKIAARRREQEHTIISKNVRLAELGWREYLAAKEKNGG